MDPIMHLVHILYRNPGKFIISQKQSISEEFRIQNTQFPILNSPNCSEGLLGDRVVGGFEQADCNPMLEKSKRKMLGGLRNENVSLRIYWKLWNWNCHGWVLQWTEERLNNSSVQLRRRISGTHVAETVIPVGFGFIDNGPVRASPLTWERERERERETHTHTHTHTGTYIQRAAGFKLPETMVRDIVHVGENFSRVSHELIAKQMTSHFWSRCHHQGMLMHCTVIKTSLGKIVSQHEYWRFLDICQRSHEPPPPQGVRACPEGLFEGM
jgi:hypothetical protein